jgi:hypothetical protein
MPKSTYITRAKKRFLEGTSYRVPVEAVTRGRRTLEQWVEILNEERDLENLKHAMSRTAVSRPHRSVPLA